MAHVVIDTIMKNGKKRRQIKSKGHNGLDVMKIKASRDRAINAVAK